MNTCVLDQAMAGRAGRRLWRLILSLAYAVAGQTASPANLPSFDFTRPADAQGWQSAHDLSPLAQTSEGLSATIQGGDPYLTGPARDYPAGQALWLRLRLKSEAGGSCQVFYYRTNPTEASSARFNVPAGKWVESRVAVPALGSGYRMRIDPPGTNGPVTLAALRFEARGPLPDFDFSTIPDATNWEPTHDISKLEPLAEGLNVHISGGDPYMYGPARNYPAGTLLWLNLRLKSDQTGTCQVFYFQNGPTEENSVRFSVVGGQWFEARIPMASLGSNYRLRIDPPGTGGACLLGRLWFEERVLMQPPAWPKPDFAGVESNAITVSAGDLQVLHNPGALGGFEVRVSGKKMAVGHTRWLAGYLNGTQPRWFSLANDSTNPATAEKIGDGVSIKAGYRDPEGAQWSVQQNFTPLAANAISVETRVTVSQARKIIYLPMAALLPGLGSFGTNKNQGLFAGLEYLENEPSSSEADLTGPAAKRQVPDVLKITFPLMAIQAEERYVGLIWEPQSFFSAFFDSPDRLFGSTGHVMGILYPGSNGANREEGSLLPYEGEWLAANQPLILRAVLIGGPGQSTIPAVQQYVQLKGLPAAPDPKLSVLDYFRRAAHGWLDSKIREANLYRHAFWPGFNAQPAADAALWMLWLSGKVNDAPLAQRLTNAEAGAIAQVARQNFNATQIGHNRYPVPALVFGAVAENAAQAQSRGSSTLGRFQPDGSVYYQPPAAGPDYGKTHWARDANGLTASVVSRLLEDAAFCGDRALIQEGLRLLRAMDKFRNTVPRGAQTWEVPLHTPDILASGYLVRAYTLGYELSGDTRFLAEARYWAWTGVPFVYLYPPTAQPIGLYSTIPVLGATGWVAPVWIGLPVQWCGLVYADALYQFARHDAAGPWKQVADGITVAGLQHSWPLSDADRQGLLPDSFQLRPQLRDGPAINPATVQAPAIRYYAQPLVYDFKPFLRHGLRVHAPGAIEVVEERADGLVFKVNTWTEGPSRILVNGVWKLPRVKINGVPAALTAPHEFQSNTGRLILQITGSSSMEIFYPATAALKIQRADATEGLNITWPLEATNYVLEVLEDLSRQNDWKHAGLPIVTAGNNYLASEVAPVNQKFYRLSLQP